MRFAHGICWWHFYFFSDASLSLNNRTMRVNYTHVQRSTNPNDDHGRVYPELSQLTKAEMTSEAASLVTRVSGQVDQFPLTNSLNQSNKRYPIHSNEIHWPMTASQQWLQRSFNYEITSPLNASSHARSPTKSTHDIGVNLVTDSTIKFTYDCVPHANRRDERART